MAVVATAAAAAAAAPTDGELQPHKKRKEDDPSIKAITKYFSPLGKNVDRMLSPPKSNNLLDYFKKTSPTNEKIASPVMQKESNINSSSLENSSKTLSRLKRKGKRFNLNNKLKDVKIIEHDLVRDMNSVNREMPSPLEEEPVGQSVPTLHVSTNKDEMLNMCSNSHFKTVTTKKEKGKVEIEGGTVKNNVKRPKKRKYKDEIDLSENFINETEQKDQEKVVNDKQLASTSDSGNKSLVNIQDHETTPQETPQLSDNTVTVSFEDFLKSQGENKIDQIRKAQTSDISTVPDEAASFQDAHQLALKKVTVLAQIHSVPPKSTSSQKIASIFLKQKSKETKRQSSPSASEAECTEPMTQKRKSNVVIAEEELELAVLETSGSETAKSKCTAEERYQFMKAFKQPESDTIKAGARKGLGKLKEAGEKSSKCKLEMEECEDVSNKRTDSEVSGIDAGNDSCSNAGKNGSTRVRNNKLKREKMVQKTKRQDLNKVENQNNDTNGQIKTRTSREIQSKLPQKNSKLRRSPRQKKSQNSIYSTPEKSRISENASHAGSVQTSTPKAYNKAFSKSDLYKAEMITEPFDSKSPIRMKFTRICTFERFMQQSAKQLNTTSSNISKAKKLVEKAKAVQKNRAARLVDETLHVPLRRSSRQQAIAEQKKLQNTEDSVILDSNTSHITVLGNVNKQKSLQSLNDVLGKKAGTVKSTKKPNAKEEVFSFVKKKLQKPKDEAIIIFDESSEGGSENSQDDKQFKEKRDFLMSGLPESLKRQIAKKASALEACFAANSCFQTVVHVQQKDAGCLMWKLMSPSCSLLTNLRQENCGITDVRKLTFSLGEFTVSKSQPCSTGSSAVSSGWQPAFSEAQTNCLLEEIKFSNTCFPVKQFFDLIVKKQAASENNKQVNKFETVCSATNMNMNNEKENKRKQKAEDRKSKRRKQMEKAETEVPNNISKVSSEKQADIGNVIHILDADDTEESRIITIEDTGINTFSGFTNEDVLWTEKYQPQNSSELIGNATSVRKLHRWLCEWKKRADWETNKSQKEEKSDSQQESSDSLDFKDGESDSEEENVLCNTMLLVGPPGTGKTAAVYACAQELGFKIFEVNASCQRNGRQILSQLKEATQSHQVDKQGVNAHKPCFFNSYSSNKSPRKKSPRKEWSPRKHPVSPRKVGLEQALAPRTLANYFKISSKPKKKEDKVQGNNRENKECFSGENVQMKSTNGETEEESSKKCATSLILFEEVDIIFDEDVGFLSAIKTFMTTTKRPVILTTNDPSFSSVFDGCFEEIIFSAPSLINVASYLQVLCLAENLRTDIRDVAALLTANKCDIRQSILHLQFWVRSGGGYLKEKGLGKKTSDTGLITSTEEPTSSNTSKSNPVVNIPKCSIGCIENSLGLTNIILPSEDLFSFLKNKITTKEEWNKLVCLLTEFQRKDIDFIYNNLEILLPLPINILPESIDTAHLTHNKLTKISSNNEPVASDCLEAASPMKKCKQSKRWRKITILDDSDLFESELNYSGFITLPSEKPSTCLEEKNDSFESATAVTQSGGISAQASLPIFQCLYSLAEFVDNTSFSDCCFSKRTRESCKYDEFIWTKGKVKNGLSDEFSVEQTDWWISQSSVELKANLEVLNFNKCFKTISEIMENSFNTDRTPGKDGLANVTLHVSEDRAHLYFGQLPANFSIHHNAQKRMELIEAIFSSRIHLNLSNRQASVIEYLPILRNICKSEKKKEQGKTKRRFLHYLEGIHLPKEILNDLATDFP
ncbi:ATPase family AAA domain-containing protein 5 isoform X1 [Pogona vitticeps]